MIQHKELDMFLPRGPRQLTLMILGPVVILTTLAIPALAQVPAGGVKSVDEALKLWEQNAGSIQTITGAFEYRTEMYDQNQELWVNSERLYGEYTSKGLRHRFDVIGERVVRVEETNPTHHVRNFTSTRVITPEKDLEWTKNRKMVTINRSSDGLYVQMMVRVPHSGPFAIPEGEIRDNLLEDTRSKRTTFEEVERDGKPFVLMIQASPHPTISGATVESELLLSPQFGYLPAERNDSIVFGDKKFLISIVKNHYLNEGGVFVSSDYSATFYSPGGNATPTGLDDFEGVKMIPTSRLSTVFSKLRVNASVPDDVFEVELPPEVTIVDRIAGITTTPSDRKGSLTDGISDSMIEDFVADAKELSAEIESGNQEQTIQTIGLNPTAEDSTPDLRWAVAFAAVCIFTSIGVLIWNRSKNKNKRV